MGCVAAPRGSVIVSGKQQLESRQPGGDQQIHRIGPLQLRDVRGPGDNHHGGVGQPIREFLREPGGHQRVLLAAQHEGGHRDLVEEPAYVVPSG